METNDKKLLISSLIKIEGLSKEEICGYIETPQDLTLGDLALPCFRFSKALRKSPKEIAESLANSIVITSPLVSATALNGYLNFVFDKTEKAERVFNEIIKGGYGTSKIGDGKTICIDYSSINIAKPFHIGHLSTTVIGGALYRIYKKLGYNAVGINHLGDWGTQFGKLIVAFKMWGDYEILQKRGMSFLTELYVRYHEETVKNPNLDDQSRYYFKKIEDKDPEAIGLFNLFKQITLEEVAKTYKRLKIDFDSYNGESFYNDKMDAVLTEIDGLGLLKDSENAKVVDLEPYDMPPCLLVKADGATLYATRDLAAAMYRKKTYDFYKCLYVVAYQQNLHFKQWFKVIELMKKPWADSLVHVPFGMVSLEEGTMSTRKGKVVLLEDVLNKAKEKAFGIINEKNPGLDNKDLIAEQIGVGAVIFFVLSNNRIKDIVFSYDKVLNFEGETCPYLQYTNARCNSVLKRANVNLDDYISGRLVLTSNDLQGIFNPEGDAVVTLLEKYKEVLIEVTEKYEPSLLSRYIIDLAQTYNKFYLAHRIMDAAPLDKLGRVFLTYCVHTVIEDALSLLGIDAPEVM